MWLFTTVGFFSIVQKRGQDYLTVRSRCASDLDSLRQIYMPPLSATIDNAGTDYPFRATISHEDFTTGMEKIIQDIKYGNFKNEVAKRMGLNRERIYEDVWGTLHRIR